MTESEFENLLKRYRRGICTPEEKARLEKWYDSYNRNETPFFSEADELRIREELRQSVYQGAGISGKLQKHVYVSFLLKIAATVLVAVMIGYGSLTYYHTIEEQRYALTAMVSGSAIQKVLLSDGTIVWLKPNSSLSYPKNFRDEGERVVTLQGEALFEVERDPARPFLVHSGELTTRVLGTSFNIRNTDRGTEVFVLTGKVSVTSVYSDNQIELQPNEKAVYANAARELEKVDTTEKHSVAPYVAGTEYNMDFFNTPIREIAKRIEGKFNVDMTIDGPMDACLITANFTDQSLNTTMEMIAEALNATYSINKREVTLAGPGCSK